MRKIFASGLILAVLLAISMSVPALASVGEEEIGYVESVNRRIQHLIDKAVEQADKAIANGEDGIELTLIRMDLVFTAGEIVAKAMAWAENKGITLVHTDIEVMVGGVMVTVDPIHVLW